eukprot:sb/3474026/
MCRFWKRECCQKHPSIDGRLHRIEQDPENDPDNSLQLIIFRVEETQRLFHWQLSLFPPEYWSCAVLANAAGPFTKGQGGTQQTHADTAYFGRATSIKKRTARVTVMIPHWSKVYQRVTHNYKYKTVWLMFGDRQNEKYKIIIN